jgi:hypothetical protein
LKPWSNLAGVVYRRTYSRKDSGTLETWNQTVERAIHGNVKGKNVPETEVKELLRLAKERKAGPAGRGYWFSGTAAHEKIGGVALNNCFSGNEKFVTSKGIRAFADVIGQRVAVLDENRSWVETTVSSHGEQHVVNLTLQRYGNEKIVRVTPDHDWYARRTTKEGIKKYKTSDLPIGGYITSFTSHTVRELSYEGIAHGVVFGDGTLTPHGSKVQLIGHKVALAKFFARPIDSFNTISYCPKHYKDLPSLNESHNYLAGFLAGVIATDGSVHSTTGQVTISAKSVDTINGYRDIATVLGVDTSTIRKETKVSNFTGEEATAYVLPLLTYSLPEQLLVLAKHADSYEQRDKKSADDWKIVDVSSVVGYETVYCVDVPTTHTFTLEGNIFTGNCWFLTADNWEHFIIAQDLLMLGGGVGFSVEHQFTSKLPKVKKDVQIVHKPTKDADFIVSDSREGWCELSRRIYESFFVTGKSFSFSTVCVRGYGELIVGFGGTASGPQPLVHFVNTICAILSARGGKHVRTTDASDILTATGELVVSGNVRRSAILILGDCWDKEYLKMKRWDLVDLPSHRSCANYSVVCDDVEDFHPLFWKTYEQGEPFGVVNRTNIQKYGRMGELKPDTAIGMNPCAEACLENGEPCNLTEMALSNMENEEEFVNAARLMQRYAKRVTMEHYHHGISSGVIARNRRTGNGITGCLASSLFTPNTLNRAYHAIQEEDRSYSKELGIPLSKRTTVVKPSGTMSKVLDCDGYEGIHAAYSRYIIQRVRFASNDPLIPKLRTAGHHIEPLQKFDGSPDPTTLVVDFYVAAPDGQPVADENWDTWKQLDILKMAQRHWADQAVSVTVYYKREDIPQLKTWLAENLQYLKSISFLCHGDHNFKQAPKETITQEQFEKLSAKIKPISIDEIEEGAMIPDMECEGGVCPVR